MSYKQCQWAEAGTVCSRTLLMRPSTTEKATESMRACRWTTLWTFIVSTCDYNKSYGRIKHKYLKQTLLYCRTCDFRGLKVSQGKVCTINRSGCTSNHLSMAYLLSNICTKNYWNWTTIVEIIVGGWVVSFFWDRVYIQPYVNNYSHQTVITLQPVRSRRDIVVECANCYT